MGYNYESTYLFFNLLLLGLLTSEIYYSVGRSQRGGLALGLIFVGLLLALSHPEIKATLKREWLRLGAVLILIISLTCGGELAWGEARFKVILMIVFITVGLLSAWSQGDIGHLPPPFWLWVSAGAVTTTFALSQAHVDLGAYLGAWGWVISQTLKQWPKLTFSK